MVEPASIELTYEDVAKAPRVTRKVTRTVRRMRFRVAQLAVGQ